MSAYDTVYGAFPAVVEQIAPGLNAQAAAVAAPGSDWLSAIAQALPTVTMAVTQKRLLDIQLERARAGLAPLDMSNYGLGVNVGLSPETQKLLLLGGGALLVVYFMSRRRGR